jgi:hypothetical protein
VLVEKQTDTPLNQSASFAGARAGHDQHIAGLPDGEFLGGCISGAHSVFARKTRNGCVHASNRQIAA